MTRKPGLLIVLLCCTLGVAAQTTQTTEKKLRKPVSGHNAVKASADKAQTTQTHKNASPAKNVPAKDTTAGGVVANEVEDSVTAQIKAPIVQVPVTLKSLIIPGALFAYGAVTLNSSALLKLNQEVKETVWDKNPHHTFFIENYGLLIPAAAVYVLNFAGVKGQNNLIDRSVIYGMSNAIANGIVFGVKQLGSEARPDASDRSSFPSGHTAEAFVSAEFLHQEYKGRIPWPYIAMGYAVGVGTAYMRMYNNKHWLGDVVAGAGVGIASTRFSYYLYPIIKHALFGSRKVKQAALIMPTYREGGGYGLTAMYNF